MIRKIIIVVLTLGAVGTVERFWKYWCSHD